MERFGLIIRTLRKQKGMTQAALAGDVCSLKHLYSIERGIRMPSGYMLGQLGRKLGVNLFSYFPYLNCADPVAMKEAMDRMAKRRRQLGYCSLAGLRRELECLEDFRRPPWPAGWRKASSNYGRRRKSVCGRPGNRPKRRKISVKKRNKMPKEPNNEPQSRAS